MDYGKLKGEIKEIANIASNVPEPFRVKCFEILLTHLLTPKDAKIAPYGLKTAGSDELQQLEKPKIGEKSAYPLPSTVKAFMKKTETSEDDISRVIYLEDGEGHFIAEPSTTIISRGQIEWALLMALQNAIGKNSFEVDPEDLRSMCQDKGYYDKTNFWKAFKSAKNKAFFQGELVSQGDARELTSAGQEELAKVIRELIR